MPNIFFGKPKGDVMEFDEHESEHLKVTRIEEGERIEVTDGKGILYKVILRKIGKKKSYGDIIEAHRTERTPEKPLKVIVGSSSWERLRLLIEKSVEIGVDEIVVYRGDRSKRDYTKKRRKMEIVIRDASKQCKRTLFPRLHLFSSLKFAVERENSRIIALDFDGIDIEESELNFSESYSIIVGPESGFSEEEKDFLKKRAEILRIGRRIFRFETAAIVALALFAFNMKKL
jgi:16S rRNA (uracil1498-N3)-methyltransferase